MKRVFTVLVLVLIGMGMTNGVYSQKLSKEEKQKQKKETQLWKKKAKNYKKAPLSLRDDMENTNKQLRSLSAKNKELQDRYAACQNSLDSLESLLNSKISELAALSAKYDKLQVAYEAQKNVNQKDIIPGMVYKVQIGAFVHFDINRYLKETDKNFEGETKDGMNKYTMGNFRDYNIAETFKKDVAKMGIKDAWIVPYIDGTRVTMEEAKQYLKNQGK